MFHSYVGKCAFEEGGVLGAAEMGMGWEMEDMVLAVADMTLGSLQTVLGDATKAMM